MSIIGDTYRNIEYLLFVLKGKKPLTRAYGLYRDRLLKKALAEGEFSTTALPAGYGFRVDERIIEYPWLLSRLPAGPAIVLDAGSVLNYANVLDHPRLENKRLFISTLAPETNCFWNTGISYVYEDLRRTCYRDAYFDVVVSLSTIEHIGMDNTRFYTSDPGKREFDRRAYLEAIDEFRRVLKPGGRLYLSVPFGKHDDHGWLQVFDGQMIDELIERFSPKQSEAHYFRYSSAGWEVSVREECKSATYYDHWQEKEYGADYAAAARAVVCLELVK